MKIKVFTPDSNGRISFTKDELEKMLNEAYHDGYNDGRYNGYWWNGTTYINTSPSIDCKDYTTNPYTINCDENKRNTISTTTTTCTCKKGE